MISLNKRKARIAECSATGFFHSRAKDARVNVYFTGTVADPETVEIKNADSSYYKITETRTLGGYTSVEIGINEDKIKTADDFKEAKKNNKLTFILKNSNFETGDDTAEMKPFTLKVSDKLPTYTLTVKKADIYTGSGTVITTEKNGLFDNDDLTVTYVTEKNKTTYNEKIAAHREENKVEVTVDSGFTDEKKGCLLVTDSSWVDGAGVWLSFPVAAKTTKNLKLVLSKKSMTLNTNEATLGQQTGTTALTLTDGAIPAGEIGYTIYEGRSTVDPSVSPLDITIDSEDGSVKVQATENALNNGTYKVEFAETGDTKQTDGKAVVLTVKTTDKAPVLSASLKGKLDLIATDAAVYVIPKLTNYDGDYILEFANDADAAKGLTLDGKDGHWALIKDKADSMLYQKGNIEVTIKAVDTSGNEIAKMSKSLKVPVAAGKFTASGTMVNLDGTDVTSAESNIEGIYVYSIYDANGKASKAFITFTGEAVELSNFKGQKDKIDVGRDDTTADGVVKLTKLSKFKTGAKSTVTVSVKPMLYVDGKYQAPADTSLKAVNAKIQVKAKVK
ncbi:MAG: hypothetical protein IJT16_05500 [Lachnospiraceae bacterium]|nr:hypothetical protein [Lachnospiraceae bacterium]